jgi:hypothetical protein
VLAILPNLEGIQEGQKSDDHKDQAYDETQPIYLGENERIAEKRINPMCTRFQEKEVNESKGRNEQQVNLLHSSFEERDQPGSQNEKKSRGNGFNHRNPPPER